MTQPRTPCVHQHDFHEGNEAAERGTRIVVWLTLVTMVVEIAAGYLSNSMALLADGWHMSSHAVAIGLSTLAYVAARRLAQDRRFAFGTWKIEILGGFASALFLVGVAALMVTGSVERLLSPEPIMFAEAMAVAALGLLVNIVSAFVLHGAHDHHDHHDSHAHSHGSHSHEFHRDLNLRSAYLHVIADAATSVLAIVALLGGMLFGWQWLDPVIGIVGAVVILVWAAGLLRETARVLIDAEMDHPVVDEIRDVIDSLDPGGATKLTDLHAWRVSRSNYMCVLSIETPRDDITPDSVRQALAVHEELVHVTVEINRPQQAHGAH